MEYRLLGGTGLMVSAIGFGNMINYHLEDEDTNVAIIKTAYESGINFFDTAEMYGHGMAEEALGRAIIKLEIPREKLVISTKIFNRNDQLGGNPINRSVCLSRKHIIEGADLSLKRLQMDYVDVIFAHQYDPKTTLEEVCKGFNDVIEQGKAFYWATSNWNCTQIQEAINICDELGLHRPIADQCQYNLLERRMVEVEFTHLYENYKYGTTIWSPLCGGILTGKYNDHVPEICRLNQGLGWIPKERTTNAYNLLLNNEVIIKGLKELAIISKEIGCNQSQLALAWTMRNKDVSTSLIGARSVAQLKDSLGAIEIFKKFTPELEEKIHKIFNNQPQQNSDSRIGTLIASRR